MGRVAALESYPSSTAFAPDAYGAQYDPGHNDGPALLGAIEAAAAVGGHVLLPADRTLWVDGVTLPPVCTIVGANRFTSRIKLRAGAAADTRVLDGRAVATGKQFSLRSFSIDGSKSVALNNTVCLELWSAQADLHDLEITGGAIEGVYLYQCNNFTASGLHCYENGDPVVDASGLHIDTCDGFTVSRLNSHHNGFHGIILTGASNGTIQGVVKNNYRDGIRAQYGCFNVHFDIIADANSLRGAYFTTGCHHCSLAGVLSGCTNGLATNEATNILSSAVSHGHAEYDIYLVAAGDTVTWVGSPRTPVVMNEGPGTVYL